MNDLVFRGYNTIVNRFQQFTLQDVEKQKGNIQWHNLRIDRFTGYRDSNGQRIFENDIITFKCTRYYGGEPRELITKNFISDVVYLDAAFVVSETQEHDTFLGAFDEKEYTIIGNIHQNKDLLDGRIYED